MALIRPPLGRIVALSLPYHGRVAGVHRSCRSMHWPCGKPCRAPRSRYKNCIATLAPTARRVARLLRRIVAHARPYRSVATHHVTAYLAIHQLTRSPSCHDTPIRITTQSPTVKPCAHARRPTVSWRMHGRVVAESLPYHGPPATPSPVVSLACHGTIHCIVTQSWENGQ